MKKNDFSKFFTEYLFITNSEPSALLFNNIFFIEAFLKTKRKNIHISINNNP